MSSTFHIATQRRLALPNYSYLLLLMLQLQGF